LTGAHVLVVDDNATNRKLVAMLLAHEGYRVSEAADGAEALVLAQAGQPDLVISDILMPSMDGYEFVRRLRADAATANLRVIFYTANYHEREAVSLARQCGVSRVIVKPCAAADLMRAVAEELAGGPAPAPAPPESSFDLEHLRLLTDKLSQNAETLRAANGRLAALTELNLQMASERDPRQLLHSVCVHARNLLGARFSALAVTDKQRADGLMAFVSGLPSQAAAALRDPRHDDGVLGRVFAQRSVLRLQSKDDQPLDLGLPDSIPGIDAALAVPVCSHTRNYGWLCLGGKVGAEAFDAEDERMLTILGAQLGRIYENGSLYREVQEQAAQLMVEMQERGRAAGQLRASEERFRELAEKIQDVFFVAGPDMVETSYVSPGFEPLWGRPAAFVLHRAGSWMESVHPADRARVQAELRQLLAAFPDEGRLEFRIVRPDDSVRWVLTRIFAVTDDHGAVVRTVGVSKDITERKLAELRIVRLNRTHSVLSGINSLIVRATDRQALLWDACRLAVDKGGFLGAWCGLTDAMTPELRAAAFAGNAPDLAAAVRLSVDEAGARASLVADAAWSRQIRVCNDLAGEDAPAAYREQLLAAGYRSLVALPLVVAGAAAGCLVLLTDAPDYFDEEELRLLAELADDISFALDHIGKAERLEYLASFDALTGLANRRAFEQRVTQYVEVAARTHGRFAVVVADPERFEAVNSTLGRAAGDELLRQLAQRFVAAAGGEDVSAHMGADQFAAIVPVDGARVTRLLDDLWQRWLGAPFEVGGQVLELTAKAGVALYPDDGTSAEALLANASTALRDAKESGKAAGFYTPHLSERFAERLALEKDLRRALDNGEYELHYQPKVDLAHRKVRSVEALLRWRSPQHGLIAPATFVPLLEENGMIVEVGAWVLRQACHDRARWARKGQAVPRVAVNVSAVQLRRDDFVRTIADVVGLPGNGAALDIEVTESILMEDVEDSLAKLAAVKELGVGIALDDFGTGYSSLAYLAKLPVSELKIDRSFVSAMLDDPSVTTLVSTIISLARSLKLDTVAEGVELEEQAKLLHLLGCDQIQGYLVGRPLPFDDLVRLLDAPRSQPASPGRAD
jgi:diguanylate cyclase (GGDEF)-like protein/PAS domain S-box-containing protein